MASWWDSVNFEDEHSHEEKGTLSLNEDSEGRGKRNREGNQYPFSHHNSSLCQ